MVICDAKDAKLLDNFYLANQLFGALRNLDERITNMHVVTHGVYRHLVEDNLEITKVDVKT